MSDPYYQQPPHQQQQYQQYPGQQVAPVAYPAAAYPAVALTDRQPTSTAVIVIAWVVTAFTSFYMLPWAIAATRGKANQWAVFAVSLLLGWTGIGWIVALVMSLTGHRPVVALAPMVAYPAVMALPSATAPAPGWYPNPNGAGQQYWDGQRWTGRYA